MRSKGARLSIGAKLTLRYTAAMAVTLTVVALFVYAQVARRVNREAKLLVEVETQALAQAYRSQLEQGSRQEALAHIGERMQQLVRSSNPSLGLGVELVSESGERLVQAGSLSGVTIPLSRSLLDGQRESMIRAVNMGEEFAYLSMATRVPGGAIQLVLSTKRYAENIAQIREVFLLSLPLVLLLTAAAGWFLARGSLRPITHITRTARRIRGANLDETVPVTGSGDELDQLAGTLNEMLARIQDSMGKMRRFNANVAHELRTPLTAISSQVEVTLERPRKAEEYEAVLGGVNERVQALSQGVDAMLRLARSEAGLDPAHSRPTRLFPILETVHDFFSPLAEENQLRLQQEHVPDVVLLGDASWLHQLFSNLVVNGLKYTPPGGRVVVRGHTDGEWLCVSVSDTGAGIPKQELARVFDRYQSSGQVRGEPGVGLGLPIAREIARAHGGRIEVESVEGRGTTFTVWLPIMQEDSARA